jgi:muramidase (phage lysozyme)
MADRKPGPLCSHNSSPIDTGTLCRSQSPLPGPTGINFDSNIEKTIFPPAYDKKVLRLSENRAFFKNVNVRAFLQAIATAEGGDYNLKFGGVKGKKNDQWQFSDFSTHPGTGRDGHTTAAGMYQINEVTWQEMRLKMGLTDFSSETQDLLAIEILRTIGVIDNITVGDIDKALSKASRRWAALPQGKDKPGRYPQPYIEYVDFCSKYKSAGGTIK